MDDAPEKRGPVEKGKKGWPINPFGVIALAVFSIVVVFLIVKPLLNQKTPIDQQSNNAGGQIVTPQSGDIVKNDKLTIELMPTDPGNVLKVEFWAKSYPDNKWQMIGDASSAPYRFEWKVPDEFQNKAVAITSHIFTKDGKEIKDPGGWREGVILLSQ